MHRDGDVQVTVGPVYLIVDEAASHYWCVPGFISRDGIITCCLATISCASHNYHRYSSSYTDEEPLMPPWWKESLPRWENDPQQLKMLQRIYIILYGIGHDPQFHIIIKMIMLHVHRRILSYEGTVHVLNEQVKKGMISIEILWCYNIKPCHLFILISVVSLFRGQYRLHINFHIDFGVWNKRTNPILNQIAEYLAAKKLLFKKWIERNVTSWQPQL